MFILACIINLGKSGLAKNNVTEDDLDRYGMPLKVIPVDMSRSDVLEWAPQSSCSLKDAVN